MFSNSLFLNTYFEKNKNYNDFVLILVSLMCAEKSLELGYYYNQESKKFRTIFFYEHFFLHTYNKFW